MKEPARTVRVRCTFELDVEVPADATDDEVQFMLEENSCPWTGPVGSALDAAIERAEQTSTCWCCPAGSNKVVCFRPPVSQRPIDDADVNAPVRVSVGKSAPAMWVRGRVMSVHPSGKVTVLFGLESGGSLYLDCLQSFVERMAEASASPDGSRERPFNALPNAIKLEVPR